MKTHKVMVVEDELLIQQNIISKIQNANPNFQVVYAASNGLDALEHLDIYQPDLLITDIQMPVLNGLELLARIRETHPDLECIILTGYNEFEYARRAMKYGVREYLLKPLKIENVSEILESVQARLLKKHLQLERNIIVSKIHGSDAFTELPSSLKTERFIVSFINLGHLLHYISAYETVSYFLKCWETIELENWLKNYSYDFTKWWLIDDKHPNQKFLILSCPRDKFLDVTTFGQEMLSYIGNRIHPVIVNICANLKLSIYNEIWSLAQQERLYLEHHLCLGKSLFFPLEAKEETKEKTFKGNEDIQDILLNLISTNNHQALNNELKMLCQNWDKTAFPQRTIEKQLFHIIEKAYQQFLPASEAEIVHLEYEFCEKLSISPNLMGIFEFIVEIFENLLQLEENDIYAPQELVKRIRIFIEQNYMTSISLETISQSFHFNSSYLTKIFKKYMGETPLKYIIDLRIEKAKNLMKSQPNLSIKDISHMIGYYDQHYFSRIFKNVTGKSPSEFRKIEESENKQDFEIHI